MQLQKKFWGSGDFLHIFWAYRLLVTFPLNYIKKFQEKSKKSQKNLQKITQYENFDFAPKCYFSMGLCLNHT